MNITPNYQLRMFNSRVSNQQQTNPSFAGAKQYTAPVARLVTGAEALGLLALMSSNLNPGKKEEIKVEPPTREGFQAILKKDGIGRREEKWLRAYDINAEKTITLYYLEDKYGKRIASHERIPLITTKDKFLNYPWSIKEVVDTENGNGVRTFSFLDACAIVDNAGDFPKGLTKMLGMHDKFGNFRFLETDDYVAAEVFEKYPEESEKYADAVDEMGNSRFGGNAIAGIITAEMLNEPIKANPENINDFIYCRYVDNVNRIISAKNTGDIKPEDIDNILNLRRNDGSYVFNELPNCSTIKCYVKAPELFTKICNIRVPNSKRYVDPNYIDGLINRFISYPNETKQLLQMPGWNQYESRWSESDILEADKEFNVLKICANAPKAFMTLASLIDTSELQYIFRMKDICKIIIRVNYGKEILEFSKEDLQAIYELTQIRTKEKGSGNTDYLNADKICNLFNTYKQYPTETKEIIDNYFIEDEYGDIVSLIPSKADVELYINNRAEFEKQYPQEWG